MRDAAESISRQEVGKFDTEDTGVAMNAAQRRRSELVAGGMLDPIVPAGSRIGRSNCRASDGVPLSLAHFTQFTDTCTHLHIDFADTDGVLLSAR